MFFLSFELLSRNFTTVGFVSLEKDLSDAHAYKQWRN